MWGAWNECGREIGGIEGMFLGSVLIIGGLWWAWEVRRRPAHTASDFRGPVIMIATGMVVLAGFFWWLQGW